MHLIHLITDPIDVPGKQGKLFWGMASFASIAVIGSIDYLTGFEISFSFFYLIPVYIASWHFGRQFGLFVALICAITWYVADIASGHIYSAQYIGLWNMLTRFGFYVIFTILLDRLRESYQAEQKLARTDRTTGAANSRYFYEVAQLELERARRTGNNFAIAYIDLDNFKFVNDQFGHLQGDALLRSVVDTAQGNLRAIDIIARLGGDEFAVLLPETGEAGAKNAVSKIQTGLLEKMRSNNWPVTFSMGVVIYTAPPSSVDAMLHEADQLMYAIKSNNKNGVSYAVRSG